MVKKRRRTRKKPHDRDIPLSLNPLSFEEAVSDLLKVKPPPRKKPKASKRIP